MIAFTTQHVVIEVPERTRQIAQNQTLSKKRNAHDEGKR